MEELLAEVGLAPPAADPAPAPDVVVVAAVLPPVVVPPPVVGAVVVGEEPPLVVVGDVDAEPSPVSVLFGPAPQLASRVSGA